MTIASSGRLRWRVLRDEAGHGTRNMALDHALATCVAEGEATLRLYTWSRPTVSFGRNEPAGGYDREAAADRGIDFVRRPTGGRAVLHADELTYAVVAPIRALGGLRGAYLRINEGLLSGLRMLGVSASAAEGAPVLGPDAGPCFRQPAPGEVVADGRKLVGSAQARVGSALLQHGSIILSGDQAVLHDLAGASAESSRPSTLFGLMGEVARADVADAVAEGLQLALAGTWTEGDYYSQEIAEADRLERERYARDGWTWRR